MKRFRSRGQSQMTPDSRNRNEGSSLSKKEGEPASALEPQFSEEDRIKLAKVMSIFGGGQNVKYSVCNLASYSSNWSPSQSQMKLSTQVNSKKKESSTQYDRKSLFAFHYKTKYRKAMVKIIESSAFDVIIIGAIVLNSLALACFDYSIKEFEYSFRNKVIEMTGQVFNVVFFFEFIFKVTAMGFICHDRSYLRDGWNWIDFLVVIIGIIENIPALPQANLKALRTLRVLRPLRSINAIPSMRRQISSLIKSLPALGNVVIFLFFIFILFGILGVQQFSGALYQRCRFTEAPLVNATSWEIDLNIERLCTLDGLGNYECPADRYCGSPQKYDLPLSSENVTDQELINYGYTTFDNLPISMLTLFEVVTLEGWTQIMYNLMDSNMTWMAVFYFNLVVIFGSFFLLNLILAVIMEAFNQVDEEQEKDKEKKEEEITRRLDRAAMVKEYKNELEKEKRMMLSPNSDFKSHVKRSQTMRFRASERKQRTLHFNLNENSDEDSEQRSSSKQIHPKQDSNENEQNSSYSLDAENDKCGIDYLPRIDEVEEGKLEDDEEQQEQEVEEQKEDSYFQGPPAQQSLDFQEESLKVESLKQGDSIDSKAAPSEFTVDQTSDIPERAQKNKVFRVFYYISSSSIFNFFITLLIIFNTFILAFDRYPIDLSEYQKLEEMNNALSWCFFAEMVVKLIGLGFRGYARDKFNLFDCAIVVFSTIENVLGWAKVDAGSGGAISAFRSVRLLRVFKLARSWSSFRELLGKIIVTLKDISNFSVLLFLFMFTYTLLGMELFSYKVQFDDDNNVVTTGGEYARANFNYFLKGMTTIFIVLIGEDWPSVMHDHLRATKFTYFLFFVPLYILGNLILLNLFLAILLKNFEDNNVDLDDDSVKQSKYQKFKQNLVNKLKKLCKKQVGKEQVSPKVDNVDDVQERQSPIEGMIPNSLDSDRRHNPSIHIQEERLEKLVVVSDNEQNEQGGNPTQINNSMTLNAQSKLYSSAGFNDFSIKPKIQAHPESNPNLLSVDQDSIIGELQRNEEVMKKDQEHYEEGKESGHSPPKRSATFSPLKEPPGGRTNRLMKKRDTRKSFAITEKISDNQSENKMVTQTRMVSLAQIKQDELEDNEETSKKVVDLYGRSFFLLGTKNCFRNLCAKIVNYRHFDNFIIVMILFSTLLLTVESPLDDPKGSKADFLFYTDIFVTTIFTFECFSKIIVFGFLFNGKDSYLRLAWNILDFIIVLVALVSLTFSDIQLNFIKVLRVLRVLRPLRMISRNEGLKVAVESLINSIPGIVNVMVISMLFLMLFGILGTNLYKGTYYYCNMDKVPKNLQENIKTMFDCINYGGQWSLYDANFDNIGSAMLTLFNIITTEGWVQIMWNGVDATSVGKIPKIDNGMGSVFFFMSFVVVGSLFILNLFVGVVINTFNNEQERLSKNHLMTKSQQEWVETQIGVYKSKPEVKFVSTGSKFRDLCKGIAERPIFDNSVMVMIILNTVVLALKWYHEPKSLPGILENINYFFAAIFTVEAIIKIVAFGKHYFTSGWNLFDFIIVIGTFAGIILSKATEYQVGPSTTVIRSFRIGRIFRLVRKYKELRQIFNAFVLSIPALANVGGLLFLFLYLYSVLGISMFAKVQLQGALNVHANFQSFDRALLTLIRVSTGEAWNEIMYDCARPFSINFECVDDPTYYQIQANGGVPNGCGSPLTAYIFFISFMLVVSFIFLNLFIAIILEGFTNSSQAESLRVQESDIQDFQKAWKEFDPDGEGFIQTKDFQQLLVNVLKIDKQKLDNYEKHGRDFFDQGVEVKEGDDTQETGFKVHKAGNNFVFNRYRDLDFFIAQLKIQSYKKYSTYHYHDVLSSLVKAAFDRDYLDEPEEDQENEPTPLKMSQVKKEEQEEKFVEDFEEILIKLELKGKRENIRKFQTLKKLQKKHITRQKTRMDRFQGQKKDDEGRFIQSQDDKNKEWVTIDSSHIVFVPILEKHIIEFLDRQREKKGLPKIPRDSTGRKINTFEPDVDVIPEFTRPEVTDAPLLDSNVKQLDEQQIPETLKKKDNGSLMHPTLRLETDDDQPSGRPEIAKPVKEEKKEISEVKLKNALMSPTAKDFQSLENEDTYFNTNKSRQGNRQSRNVPTLTTEGKITIDEKHVGSQMHNSKIIPNCGLMKQGKKGNFPTNDKERIVTQRVQDQVLEASRPFTPSRIQTPALFNGESRRDNFVRGLSNAQTGSGTNEVSRQNQRVDFSPITTSFEYSHKDSIKDDSPKKMTDIDEGIKSRVIFNFDDVPSPIQSRAISRRPDDKRFKFK